MHTAALVHADALGLARRCVEDDAVVHLDTARYRARWPGVEVVTVHSQDGASAPGEFRRPEGRTEPGRNRDRQAGPRRSHLDSHDA